MNVKILVIVSLAFENISAIYMTAKNYNHYLMNDSSGEMKNVLRIKSRYVIGIGKLLVTIAPKSLCQNVDVIDGTTINERVNDRRKIGKFIIGQSEITVFWQRLSTRRQRTFSYDVLMLLYRCTPRRFGAHFRFLWFGINSYHILICLRFRSSNNLIFEPMICFSNHAFPNEFYIWLIIFIGRFIPFYRWKCSIH